MNKTMKIIIALLILISVASAAVLTMYFSVSRDIVIGETISKSSFMKNNADWPATINPGEHAFDIVTIISGYDSDHTIFVNTIINFNGEPLADWEGIEIAYVSDYVSVMDAGAPGEFTAIMRPNATTKLERHVWTNQMLVPGTYTIITEFSPLQGDE